MAPDLNAVAAGEKWDYSTPGSSGYNVPDIVLNVRLRSSTYDSSSLKIAKLNHRLMYRSGS